MSKYYDYDNKQPAFRVQMTVLNKSKFLSEFTKMLESKYSDDMKIEANVARYIDTIKTKLAERQVKKK